MADIHLRFQTLYEVFLVFSVVLWDNSKNSNSNYNHFNSNNNNKHTKIIIKNQINQ